MTDDEEPRSPGPGPRRPPRPREAGQEAPDRRTATGSGRASRPLRPSASPKNPAAGAPGPRRRRRGATAANPLAPPPPTSDETPSPSVDRPVPSAARADLEIRDHPVARTGVQPAVPAPPPPPPPAEPVRPRAKRPIPEAPGPRPERPARPTRPSAPRPPAVSTVRFRTTETGSVQAVAVAPEADGDEDEVIVDDILPPLPSPRTAFRKRYGVVYNTQGPKVRLGALWALIVFGALAVSSIRPYGLATVYGVVAGAAALQIVDVWQRHRTGADRWVAALGASALPVLATLGVRPLGVALLVLVVAAVVVALRSSDGSSPYSAAGHTVLAAGLCGMAAASIVLLADYEIGAVIILLVYLMAYDASDYAVGSGAGNGIEGPLAGALAIVCVTCFFAVIKVPPFRGADIWNFAVLAAIACPGGQLLASAMLPKATSFAPALRRLDSLLIVGPAWALLVGLYLQRVTG